MLRCVCRAPDRRPHKIVVCTLQPGAVILMTEAEYRERADRCEKEATATRNFEIKAQLERLAQYWRELALMAEHRTKERY
jgi:hypothetical protein